VYDKKRKNDVYPVRTSDFQTKIEDICKMRDDEWALDVRGRLKFVQDLHAADALYHQQCRPKMCVYVCVYRRHYRLSDIAVLTESFTSWILYIKQFYI
jgi:hypothetical protein